jgi:hypothetical protein
VIPGWSNAQALLRYSSSRHESVPRNTSHTWFGTLQRPIRNAEIDEGSLRTLALSLQFQRESMPYGIGPAYAGRFDVERSLGGSIVENGGYTKIDGSIVWRIPTFYRRRLLPNALDFKLAAGTATGDLPRQRFGIIDGSTLLTTFGGLRTRDDRPYEGESYAAFIAEHSFRTILFERLGLDGLARHGWNVILTGGVARVWTSDSRAEALSTGIQKPNQLHTEIGLSFSGIFGLIRLDYARRLDSAGHRIGISVARMF